MHTLKSKFQRTVSAVGFAAAVAVGTMAPAADAHAGIPVIDVANLAESILTAVQTLASNYNEYTQIANQYMQLYHEVQNLTQLPAAVASAVQSQFTSDWNQLRSNFNSTGGLSTNLGTLAADFGIAFPDRNAGAAPTPANVQAQLQAWLSQSRKNIEGVYRQSGQVMQDMPNVDSQIQSILNQSQASSGNLDAVQANTQMQGAVASQIVRMNSQMASMFQAQSDMMAQQQQQMDVSKRRSADAMATYTTFAPTAPAAWLPAIH